MEMTWTEQEGISYLMRGDFAIAAVLQDWRGWVWVVPTENDAEEGVEDTEAAARVRAEEILMERLKGADHGLARETAAD
jgi:hypothetical protein